MFHALILAAPGARELLGSWERKRGGQRLFARPGWGILLTVGIAGRRAHLDPEGLAGGLAGSRGANAPLGTHVELTDTAG
jgi:hypothetical protein